MQSDYTLVKLVHIQYSDLKTVKYRSPNFLTNSLYSAYDVSLRPMTFVLIYTRVCYGDVVKRDLCNLIAIR